ncbi:unnamed protein product [Prorocentrum cordatum]|uniref:WW domain-containing protein n=1 Tax=Prorocentrum cordatum TaxID=2364126 RepID=A0ABN9WQP4_9DINO|nr:unnamed protein product [Polarella glacialis]
MAGHGAAQEIPGARYAPAAAAAPYPGGQYALTPAAAPYLGGQATGHPHLQPDAYRDCLETDIMGQKYWFNPHTQASAWSSQQLIRMNQQFYAGLSYVPAGPGQQHGPKGELGWWVWQGADAGQHMGWTMEALWKKVQPSISGTGEGDRPAEPQEQGLRADLDVEEAGQPHSRYWYNPKTLANAWTREDPLHAKVPTAVGSMAPGVSTQVRGTTGPVSRADPVGEMVQ